LNKIKNLQKVIDVFELLQNDIDYDLLIIGENTKTFNKSQLSVPQIGKNKIIFKGQINDSKELINLYKNAVCLVFPSLYEASPLPPIEAMACGCPVIASNIPSLKERCGDAAIYCNPEDVNDIAEKILKVINDKKLRESYIKKGLLKSRDYTWKKCTEETLKLIKNLG
jgi:glycosyltransferase involved in cell wall biosynthesis